MPRRRSDMNNQTPFTQMEAYLLLQLERCKHYKSFFESQANASMVNKFDTLIKLTARDLEILRTSALEGSQVPNFTFEIVPMVGVPINVDVKEKELKIEVRVSSLPVAKDSTTYIIAEFDFARQGTFADSIRRYMRAVSIDPKNLMNCCCSSNCTRQLDVVFSTDIKPFNSPESKSIEFNRAIQFFVDKGQSRNQRRRFRPVKLTVYEKTSLFCRDRRIGSVQIRVDGINEDALIVSRHQLVDNRKQLDAMIDVKVKVREPLVDKSLRTHEEKILVLT